MKYGNGKYTYELVDPWAKLPEGETFVDVCGISIDSDDKIYVFNRSKRPMIVFDRAGNELSYWGEGLFNRPHGSCLTPDNHIWVTDDNGHVVYKFTKDGKLVMTLGKKGQPCDNGYRLGGLDTFEKLSSIKRGGPPFNLPTGVAISSTGDIFVSDGYGNTRVHKFNAEGELLFSWGEPGGKPGQFLLPHNIWIDRLDRIWVSDRENSRVQIFDTDGKLLDVWTDIIRPTQVCIDVDDTVYISELCRRISIFSIDGKVLTRWGNESRWNAPNIMEDPLLVGPHVIGVDSIGDIYVGEVATAFGKVDRGARTIQKFARIA
ncbi:peptidyl-alpha-hydroxyglycine alpha-amidating lyase family protein [Chloroflexota bacterium]